ncbi:sigma-70 family RNA polymerase sigma factor [Barnesiella propionica]|uniref:RNA polymerase sigma factor n=1 Tax=Barnesiella propionica TaxID=2981781 RepID=UPI0011CB7FEA|nr:sigma-70 family RNA polymerase sigma factor [Barnesiella propionica]MCU6769502.1 sigma-70 family RNA polymerase sigma factor [Barnesiella propionica]
MEQERICRLIEKCRQGDTVAFASIVREYQPLVYRLSFRLLCNEEEARDITQDSFIKIWLSLAGYNPRYRLSTWIYRITCNICCDRLRVLQRSPERRSISEVESSGLNLVSDTDPYVEMDNRELKDLILKLTEGLSPKQKIVFILRDIEELDVDEIKEITGLSPEKIKSNLYLARKNIRDKLKSRL